MTKRYFIFDDHPNIRRGIKAYLSENSDWQCAGEASTCEEAVALVDSLPADAAERAVYAAIVDASFKDKVVAAQSGSDAVNANGFAIIRYIKSRALPIPCIVYSSYDFGGFIEYAMSNEIGADAYVTKNAEESVILTALYEVSHGRTFIQGDIITRYTTTLQALSYLTRLERQMYRLACDGLSNQQIAERLGKNIRTVENYMSRLYDKFDVKSRAELLNLRSHEHRK